MVRSDNADNVLNAFMIYRTYQLKQVQHLYVFMEKLLTERGKLIVLVDILKMQTGGPYHVVLFLIPITAFMC